jgi:metallo-beta-lactamase class B
VRSVLFALALVGFELTSPRAFAIGGPAIVPSRPSPPSLSSPAGPPPVRGELDPNMVARVIRSHMGEVKGCYERALAGQPDLAGRVTLHFTINLAGQVESADVESSTIDSQPVEVCILWAARQWHFSKPVGGPVDVSFPFVFSSNNPPDLRGGQSIGGGRIDIRRLDARLFVHQTHDAGGTPANGLIAITDKGLLLVDTGWNDAQTEAILDWGRAYLKRDWVGAVITHDHADRDGGVGALLRRGIPVAALDLTVKKLAARGIRSVAVLFTTEAVSMADPRGFEAYYPGRGHAPDNIVVAFPWSNVLFGGCLVKAPEAAELGFTGDADLASWVEALRRVGARYAKMPTIVPGHGAVEGATIQHTLDLLGERLKAGNASPPK